MGRVLASTKTLRSSHCWFQSCGECWTPLRHWGAWSLSLLVPIMWGALDTAKALKSLKSQCWFQSCGECYLVKTWRPFISLNVGYSHGEGARDHQQIEDAALLSSRCWLKSWEGCWTPLRYGWAQSLSSLSPLVPITGCGNWPCDSKACGNWRCDSQQCLRQ